VDKKSQSRPTSDWLFFDRYTGSMRPPRLLVFDLDGTLINSSLDLCNSVNAALQHVGKPLLPDSVIASYIGDGAAMLVRRALGDPDDLDSLSPLPASDDDLFHRTFDFFLTYYRAHKLDNTQLYPGVLTSLEILRSRHPYLLMAVLTNKPVIPSREICLALGIGPFFFQNYGGNSFPTKKPDPTGLLTLIAEANSILKAQDYLHPVVVPQEVVMIGDSDVDVLTARHCGARSLGCAFGLAPAALAAAEPDATVEHASGWPDALGL
jgi:phosphoglycolate phosphatase